VRQKLVFLAPRISRGQLDCHPAAFLVQLADAVSRLCKALHKLVKNPYSQEIDAGTILNDILIMSPSTLVRLTVVCVRFR
jgi:hypothetical protein